MTKPRERLTAKDIKKRNTPEWRKKMNANLVSGRGRPKGSPNAIPRSVKEMFLTAANMHKGGGAQYLYQISITHPNLFVPALARLLPQSMKMDLDPKSVMAQMLQAIEARLQQDKLRASSIIDVQALPPPNTAP